MGALAFQCIHQLHYLGLIKFRFDRYFLDFKYTLGHGAGFIHHHILYIGNDVQEITALE